MAKNRLVKNEGEEVIYLVVTTHEVFEIDEESYKENGLNSKILVFMDKNGKLFDCSFEKGQNPYLPTKTPKINQRKQRKRK